MTRPEYGTTARSMLFVPGTRSDRFAKAAESGADAVILDLEDSVGPTEKTEARVAVTAYVKQQRALVRVNGYGSEWHEDDLYALRDALTLGGIVLPKTESPADVASIVAILGAAVPIFPILESARGIRDADRIAEVPGVARLLFGNLDFCLDIGISPPSGHDEALNYARSSIVIAARAAGLPGPVDGVQPRIDDDLATTSAAVRSLSLGFSGMLCLHPRQVPLVHAAFAPTQAELTWAEHVLGTADGGDGGVARIGGEMIDRPVIERARRIVQKARSHAVARQKGEA